MMLKKTEGRYDRPKAGITAYQIRRLERGSFVVEALVGGLIFGLVTLSLYAGFSMGFRNVRLTQEEVRANQILVENMETVRVYDWSKLTSGTFFPSNNFIMYFTPPVGTNSVGSGVPYTVGIGVSQPSLTESYSNTLRVVTATVSWNSGGVRRTRSMSTLVSQNGIQNYKN